MDYSIGACLSGINITLVYSFTPVQDESFEIRINGYVNDEYEKLSYASVGLFDKSRLVQIRKVDSSGKFSFVLNSSDKSKLEIKVTGYIKELFNSFGEVQNSNDLEYELNIFDLNVQLDFCHATDARSGIFDFPVKLMDCKFREEVLKYTKSYGNLISVTWKQYRFRSKLLNSDIRVRGLLKGPQ